MRILYVEDKPVDADLTLRQLRKDAPHFECEVVGTIGKALERLERLNEQPLDVVLTDMHLPDGNGLSLVAHIRSHALLVAVVVVTGAGDEETAVTALKTGADDYIVKRQNYLETLALTLESALQRFRAGAARRARLLKVLYVEHDDMDADLTRRHFDRHAAHIRLDILSGASEAFERFNQGNGDAGYDVLLLDYSLPGLNALELLKQLRLTCKIMPPVVLVTGKGGEDVARQAVNLGAASYVIKGPGYLYRLAAELENASFCAELIRREEALRISQERYKLAAAAGDVIVWDLDLETGEVVLDPAAPLFLQLRDTEALTFQQWVQVIHPDDRAGALEHYRRCLSSLASSNKAQSAAVPEITFRVCRSDGATRWVLLRGTVLRRDDGQPHRVLGTITDISERRNMEVALRESEQRLETMMDHSPLATFLKDTAGRYLYVNPTFEQNVQKTKENILGKTSFEMFPRNEAAAFAANDRQVLDFGEPRTFEETASRGDGPHTAIVHKFPLLDQQGKTYAIAGIVTDITSRKRAEEELREREERLQMALEAGRMGVWDWEPITGRLTWSEEHYAIMGVDPARTDKLTYLSWAGLVHPEDYPNVKESIETAIAEKRQYHCEYRVLRSDGSIRWVGAWGEPAFNQDGECVRVMGLVADITEKKRAEDSLRTALAELEHLKERVEAENVYLRTELKLSRSPQFYGGESAAMKKIYQQIDQVAATDMTVLILGETGVGKELVARAIHQTSSRRGKPLVTVNCSALPAELVESELFGHEKGAFTNAVSRQLGRFELAHEGTLFLDEIGDLPLHLQAKLLRALQEGEFERLGSGKPIKVDVRVLAATNRDLGAAIQAGEFRKDLFYRLNAFPIQVPPLRERRQDIRRLASRFLEEASVRLGRAVPQLPDELVRLLENYDWPGNVRELRNVIERAILSSTGGDLRLAEGWVPLLSSADKLVKPSASQGNGGKDQAQEDLQRTTLKDFERDHILRVLEQTKWRIEGPKGAATILGLRPSTLRSRMRKFGIQ